MIGDELGEKVMAVHFRAGEKITGAVLKKLFGLLLAGGGAAVYNFTSNKESIHRLAENGNQTHGIEVSKNEMAGFDHYAKKYHFKYSLVREENDPNSYMFIFKLKDLNLLENAAHDFFNDGRDHTTLQEKIQHAKDESVKINEAHAQEKEKTKTRSKGRDRSKER